MLEGEKNNLQANTRKKNFIVNQGASLRNASPQEERCVTRQITAAWETTVS